VETAESGLNSLHLIRSQFHGGFAAEHRNEDFHFAALFVDSLDRHLVRGIMSA